MLNVNILNTVFEDKINLYIESDEDIADIKNMVGVDVIDGDNN